MDDWDPDDYETSQGRYLWGPDDSVWDSYVEPGDEEDLDTEPAAPGRLAVGLTLKFPAVCALCAQTMPAGTFAVSIPGECGWTKVHERCDAAAPMMVPVAALPSAAGLLWPGESAFVVHHHQPCIVCGKLVDEGSAGAGRRTERGWRIRHRTCAVPRPGGSQPLGA